MNVYTIFISVLAFSTLSQAFFDSEARRERRRKILHGFLHITGDTIRGFMDGVHTVLDPEGSTPDTSRSKPENSAAFGLNANQETGNSVRFNPYQRPINGYNFNPYQGTGNGVGLNPYQGPINGFNFNPQEGSGNGIGLNPQQGPGNNVGLYPYQGPEHNFNPQQGPGSGFGFNTYHRPGDGAVSGTASHTANGEGNSKNHYQSEGSGSGYIPNQPRY